MKVFSSSVAASEPMTCSSFTLASRRRGDGGIPSALCGEASGLLSGPGREHPCEKLSRPRGVHGGDQATCAFHCAPTPRRADMAHRRNNWPCWDQSLKDGHSGRGLQPGECVYTGARAPSPSFASPKELPRKSSHPASLSAFDDLERNSRFQNPRPFN